VEGAVELPVAAAVEAVALVFARAGVERGNAGVAGEPGVRLSNTPNVPDSTFGRGKSPAYGAHVPGVPSRSTAAEANGTASLREDVSSATGRGIIQSQCRSTMAARTMRFRRSWPGTCVVAAASTPSTAWCA
jgi:hypothetical protein